MTSKVTDAIGSGIPTYYMADFRSGQLLPLDVQKVTPKSVKLSNGAQKRLESADHIISSDFKATKKALVDCLATRKASLSEQAKLAASQLKTAKALKVDSLTA